MAASGRPEKAQDPPTTAQTTINVIDDGKPRNPTRFLPDIQAPTQTPKRVKLNDKPSRGTRLSINEMICTRLVSNTNACCSTPSSVFARTRAMAL